MGPGFKLVWHMKAQRWLGQRDRINIDLQIDGVQYTVELQAFAVHVEPDMRGELYASMDKRDAPTLTDLALIEVCKRINDGGC